MTHHGQQPLAAGTALSYPATQEALTRYRRRWRRTRGFSLGLIVVSVLTAAVTAASAGQDENGSSSTLAIGLVSAGFVFVIGVALLVTSWRGLNESRRMEWILAHHPWRERHHYHVSAWSTTPLVIGADQMGPEVRCGLPTGTITRYGWFPRLQAAEGRAPLLIAGDPQQLAVITTPDMRDLGIILPLT